MGETEPGSLAAKSTRPKSAGPKQTTLMPDYLRSLKQPTSGSSARKLAPKAEPPSASRKTPFKPVFSSRATSFKAVQAAEKSGRSTVRAAVEDPGSAQLQQEQQGRQLLSRSAVVDLTGVSQGSAPRPAMLARQTNVARTNPSAAQPGNQLVDAPAPSMAGGPSGGAQPSLPRVQMHTGKRGAGAVAHAELPLAGGPAAGADRPVKKRLLTLDPLGIMGPRRTGAAGTSQLATGDASQPSAPGTSDPQPMDDVRSSTPPTAAATVAAAMQSRAPAQPRLRRQPG